VIRQGDVYWIDVEPPQGSEPGYRRPFVVIQNDLFNQSVISTVVVCALTTSLWQAEAPGNVLLEPGEAGLPKQSVVNVSQILTVDKRALGGYIGALPGQRLFDVLDGVHLVLDPRGAPR